MASFEGETVGNASGLRTPVTPYDLSVIYFDETPSDVPFSAVELGGNCKNGIRTTGSASNGFSLVPSPTDAHPLEPSLSVKLEREYADRGWNFTPSQPNRQDSVTAASFSQLLLSANRHPQEFSKGNAATSTASTSLSHSNSSNRNVPTPSHNSITLHPRPGLKVEIPEENEEEYRIEMLAVGFQRGSGANRSRGTSFGRGSTSHVDMQQPLRRQRRMQRELVTLILPPSQPRLKREYTRHDDACTDALKIYPGNVLPERRMVYRDFCKKNNMSPILSTLTAECSLRFIDKETIKQHMSKKVEEKSVPHLKRSPSSSSSSSSSSGSSNSNSSGTNSNSSITNTDTRGISGSVYSTKGKWGGCFGFLRRIFHL